MPEYRVATRKADGVGGPVIEVTAANFAAAQAAGLGASGVSTALGAGGQADYVTLLETTSAAKTGHATQATLSEIKTALDDLTTDLASRIGNTTIVLVPAGTRENAPEIDPQVNVGARGLKLFINITSLNGGSNDLTVAIKELDPVSGADNTLLTSATLDATGLTILKIYPGFTDSANLVKGDILPYNWTIEITHGNTDDISYSIAASLIQ